LKEKLSYLKKFHAIVISLLIGLLFYNTYSISYCLNGADIQVGNYIGIIEDVKEIDNIENDIEDQINSTIEVLRTKTPFKKGAIACLTDDVYQHLYDVITPPPQFDLYFV